MIFILKLLRVLTIIIIILIIGYVMDEKDSIFSEKYNENVTLSEDDIEKHEEINEVEHGLNDESEHNKKEDFSQDKPSSSSMNEPVELNETESNHNSESSQSSFTYDMEAIDKHSIGHLHKMQSVIHDYKESPHNNQEDLYKDLYLKNFMHLEEELEEKNQLLYNYMIELIGSIEEHENFSDSTSVITILDEINIILDNIINIE